MSLIKQTKDDVDFNKALKVKAGACIEQAEECDKRIQQF
jgi:hypothetical protein